MLNLEQTMRDNPVLGILRDVPLEKTLDYIEAAIRGGVSFFEVALNSSDALQQIERIRGCYAEHCIVGAGTAITPELCQQAVKAGAQFLLTPGTPLDVFQYCRYHDVALLPGVLSPSDVALSLEYGYSAMKLFPAGSMPMRYVRDLQGPFNKAQFMAIGGVNADNAADFLKAGYLSVGLASALMPKEAVRRGDWDACEAQVRTIVSKVNDR